MTCLRPLSLLLVLALTLSTVGFGIARGAAPAAGQMVICSGQGIIILSVDAEGNPVESHSLCPDAALVFHAALAMEPPAVQPADASLVWRHWPQRALVPVLHRETTLGARAPPV